LPIVRHSWNFQDGLKTTKNNEARIVELPYIEDMEPETPKGIKILLTDIRKRLDDLRKYINGQSDYFLRLVFVFGR